MILFWGATVLAKTVAHVQNMSHLYYFYRLFPIRITAGFVIPLIRHSVGFLRNVKFNKSDFRYQIQACYVVL